MTRPNELRCETMHVWIVFGENAIYFMYGVGWYGCAVDSSVSPMIEQCMGCIPRQRGFGLPTWNVERSINTKNTIVMRYGHETATDLQQ